MHQNDILSFNYSLYFDMSCFQNDTVKINISGFLKKKESKLKETKKAQCSIVKKGLNDVGFN